MFELSKVNPETRPFELNNDEIKHLCNAYAVIIEKEPELLKYDFRTKSEAKKRKKKNSSLIRGLEDQILLNQNHK